MQQKPSSISLHHRHQLQLETSSHASSSGPSRETSAAPSLLSSRRPSLSSISDHGFPTELETPTEASSRKERPTAGQAPLYMPFPSASAGQDVSNVNDTSKPSLVVLSGGSAGNSLVEAFVNLASSILFVLPVSDNGGSSSELIRVFGGPSIGDIRSRLIRLIPGTDAATEATRALLSYRLPASQSPAKVRAEWHSIVEGEHDLWRGVEPSQREILRSFLVHFEAQVLARAHRRFNFSSGSIGNFFLWGMLLLSFGSHVP